MGAPGACIGGCGGGARANKPNRGHECIDQVFAQVALAIAGSLLDCPDDAIRVMERLTRAGIDRVSNQSVAETYKLDSIADWHQWVSRAPFTLTGHACKGSPHYYRLCRRQDIGVTLADHGHAGLPMRGLVARVGGIPGLGGLGQFGRLLICL